MNQPAPILSIGDLVADLVVAVPRLPIEAGQHQVAQEMRLEPGGSANFLIAGARLGWPMMALGVLGQDIWGDQVAQALQAEGVSLAGVSRRGSTSTVIVLVSQAQAGQHVFVGRHSHVEPAPLTEAEAALVEQAGAIYLSGYTLNQPHLVDVIRNALPRARAAGVSIYFDPGPHFTASPPALRQTVLAQVDGVFATTEELPLLSEAGTAAGLLAQGPTLLVVKQGAAGCAVYQAANPNHSPHDAPGYPVTVVDTAAAGDSFNAAFIVGLQRGWPLPACAAFANAVGAAKVQKLGSGRSVPTLDEVTAILRRFDVDLPN